MLIMFDFVRLIGMFFILVLLGYGPTALLMPPTMKKWGIWFAPWIGTVIIILFNISASLANISIIKIIPIIGIFSFSTLVLALFLKKKLVFFSRLNSIILIFLLLSLFLFFFHNGQNISRNELVKASFFSDKSFVIALLQNGEIYKQGELIGPSLVIGFFFSLSKIYDMGDITNIFPLYGALLFPLIFTFFQSTDNSRTLIAICLAFAITYLIEFFLPTLNGKLSVGIGFVTIFLVYQYYVILSSEKKAVLQFYNLDLLIAITISTLTVTLSAYLFVSLLVLISSATIITWIKEKNTAVLVAFIKVMVISLSISPVTAGIVLQIR